MTETPRTGRKWLWITVGAVASIFLGVRIDAPFGMWIYLAAGILVAALWFWVDKAPDKSERWDIAVAFPIIVILWPIIALMLPFQKHFRDSR
jgi:hypothetical protein